MAITEKYASSAGSGAKDGSSEANAWDWATMLTTAAAGNRINFKGNHTLTGNAAFSNTGTVTSPIVFRGYSSTIGDCSGLGRTNDNGALITTGMPVITLGSSYTFTIPSRMLVEACNITSSMTTNAGLRSNYNCVFVKCKIENTGSGTYPRAISSTGQLTLYDCDCILSGSSGTSGCIYSNGNLAVIGGRVICPEIGYGIFLSGNAVIDHCTIHSYGRGIYVSTGFASIINNTIISESTHAIERTTGSIEMLMVIGNLLVDSGGYGIYSPDEALHTVAHNNRYDRLTSGISSGGSDWMSMRLDDNTTSATQANEFVDFANEDFRLNRLSPARQNCKPLYTDFGALGRKEDYPDPANVTSSDTTDGQTGTHTCSGGGIWMPRPRQIGV